MRLGVGHKRVAAVIGHVEPLVTIGRPRISERDPLEQVAVHGARGHPQAERAIHVHPCPLRTGQRDQLCEPVVGADVQIASLHHDNGRHVSVPLQRLAKGMGGQSAVIVGGHVDDGVSPEPEKPYRALDGAMTLAASQDADWRCPVQALALDIPSAPGEQGVETPPAVP